MSDIKEVQVAEDEYYNRFYRLLIPQPTRVLQSQEITSIMRYPQLMLKDFSDLFFDEQEYLEGFSIYGETSPLDSSMNISIFDEPGEEIEIDLPNEIELDFKTYDEEI